MLERLAIENVFVYAGLRAVFQGGKSLVAERGQAGVGACSSLREEVSEEGGGAVSRGLATKRKFGHAADRASQPWLSRWGFRDTVIAEKCMRASRGGGSLNLALRRHRWSAR
jgi:hypothetical protein